MRRNENDPHVLAGEKIFKTIGCESCHRSVLKTGEYKVSAIAHKTFSPYTDLLLHDMGPGLNDNYTEGSALPSEWRTPALWGLGLSARSQGGSFFLMHDGRARSIEGAILLHGGEGEKSRDNYLKLEENEKKDLLLFLESL
jgi:CxxC motif-containing protein (DUF1111 family)